MGSVVVGGKHRPKYAQNDACHPCAGAMVIFSSFQV